MRDYVIFTDSACDIKPELLSQWGVPYRCLTFRFDGEDKEYSNDDMSVVEFYNKMRAGGVAKTAAVNAEAFAEMFEEEALKQGKDVLYLGFSSGLSTTYNSARIAALDLQEKYPEAKIIVVDTLAASAGEGLMVYLTVEQKKNGATIEEAEAAVDEMIERIDKLVGEYIYSYDDENLNEVVVRILKEKGRTITSAESCTSGLFPAAITDVAGASEVMSSAYITYSKST